MMDEMTSRDDRGWWSIVIALVFSLVYAGLFPILVGGFVIYTRNSWPPLLAAAYVLGGILTQAWFSFGHKKTPSLWPQIVTGIVYYAAAEVFSGGIYQS